MDQKCFNQTHLCVSSPSQREKTRKQKMSSTLVACGGQARLCTWCQAGSQLDAVFGTASTRRSATTQMRPDSLGLHGQADFQGPPMELVEKVRRAIQEEFTQEPVVMPKPSYGLPSNVRADTLCGVIRAAGDPDANTLRDWLVQGAPLGMDRRIETTAVFPPADKPDKEDHSPTPDVSEQPFQKQGGQSRDFGESSSRKNGDSAPLKAGVARKHTRGGVRNYLIARRRPPAEFELVFHASPWGLGGILKRCSSFTNL